jgi:hypothetical protein
MKNFSHDSKYPSQDLNQAHPKHKSRRLPLNQLVHFLICDFKENVPVTDLSTRTQNPQFQVKSEMDGKVSCKMNV